MTYLNNLQIAIIKNLWLEIILFTSLTILILYAFIKYKKGFLVMGNYLTFLILLALMHTIQLLKRPFKPGSFLDILGLSAMIILFIIGIIIIFSGEKRIKKEQKSHRKNSAEFRGHDT